MFGYVVVNKPEMKFKEFDVYQSYYCGLCKSLKHNFGLKAQLSLNYDLNFVAILLSSLYEVDNQECDERCVVHPLKKKHIYKNEIIDYCAKMTIVLTYYKCEDDWLDEKKVNSQIYKKALTKAFNQVKKEYPTKVKNIKEALDKSNEAQKQDNVNLDSIAYYTGVMMGEVCTFKDDEWKDELYDLGFYLGKYIYLIDAYEDVEDDIKKGLYNPFKEMFKEKDFDDRVRNILEMMIAESTLAFERLPIIENSEIIRNIMYSGIWTKYELIKKKRMEGLK